MLQIPRWMRRDAMTLAFCPGLPWATYVLQPLEQVVTASVAPPVATPEKSFVAVPGVQRAPGVAAQWRAVGNVKRRHFHVENTMLSQCLISSCLLNQSPILLTSHMYVASII